MSLARRLAIVIFSAAAVAAIALAVVVYILSRDAVTVAIRERQLDAAKQLIANIDRLLNERQNDIIAMSEEQAVLNLTKQPTNAALRSQASSRLKQLSVITGPWERLYVMDRATSVVLASDTATQVGTSLANDKQNIDIVHRAQAGEVVYSDLVLDESTGKPVVMFAAPVRLDNNPGKPVTATVLGQLSWGEVLAMLHTIDVMSVNLYNHAGIEIGNKDDPSTILKEDRRNDPAVKKGQDQNNGSEILPSSDGGSETLTSYVYEPGYSSYQGNGWVLTLETATATAYAPANDAALKLVLSLLFVIGAGAATAVFLVARAVRPVGSLTKSANRLAIGDLSHRFKVISRDEFGQLGTALNNMADKLQQVYQNLEAKVREKTVRLAARTQEAEANAAKDEAILSSIGEGLVVVNNDGRIIRINVQALAILGVNIEDVLGKKILETIAFDGERGEPLEDNELPLQAALTTGERTMNTYQIKRNEAKVLLAIIANPVKLKDQTVGAIMVMRDVTKERQVDRMKTEFISLASHQLRTPLSAIKWFTEMLVAGDAGSLNKDQQEFATAVYDSTQRMIELVNSLLNISRIESGRIIVDPHPTNITKMVTGIVSDLKAHTEAKKQTLNVSIHAGLPDINLDARLIGQVYLNFLSNAIKYTPSGGEISVTVSRKGDELVSQISDNGYGIPKDQQGRVFQKFFRAENAVKVETDGTGLGLYLAKAIIESSGGRVWFRSTQNKGTTFWFSLPMSGMQAKDGEVTLDI